MHPPPRFSVPGTKFTVDWHCQVSNEYIHSFLSHAHSDHLTGIRSIRPPRVVHCSKLTEKLLLLKYPQLKQSVVSHEMNEVAIIDGVSVRFLQANHTAGSCMFLFQLADGKKILHTGDFRSESVVVDQIRPYAPIDVLYMDCTYALESLTVPSRTEVHDFILAVLDRFFDQGYHVMFGTYTLGKEYIIMEVAKRFRKRLWAEPSRLQVFQAVFGDHGIFTKNREESEIQVVSMAHATISGAIEYHKTTGIKRIVAIQLTGWSAKGSWKQPKVLKEGDLEVAAFSIPYSDHSSKEELKKFVEVSHPAKLIPTTHIKEKDILKITRLFLPWLRKSDNRNFIEFYSGKK